MGVRKRSLQQLPSIWPSNGRGRRDKLKNRYPLPLDRGILPLPSGPTKCGDVHLRGPGLWRGGMIGPCGRERPAWLASTSTSRNAPGSASPASRPQPNTGPTSLASSPLDAAGFAR
jgi:hypothetical protein